MNENAAIQSVVSAIDDNKTILLAALEQNKNPREIGFLSETVLGVPTAYYAIKVHCSDVLERDLDPPQYNSNSASPYKSFYEITVYVGDYAVPDLTQDGGFAGRTAHRNFRTFTDRIAKLIRRDQEWFPSQSDSPRFRLVNDSQRGRAVRKRMIQPIEQQDAYPLLGAEIVFTLVGCNDG